MDAARHRREILLARGWPTSREVGLQLGSRVPETYAANLRAAGRLLGAWSAKASTYVHPDCQFEDDGGRIRTSVRELLAALPAVDDEGGWRRTFWLYGPREEFRGRTPAELLVTDPAQVLELARLEFDLRR
jgi:hypothetical protein